MFDCFYFTDIFNEKYIVKDVHKDGNCAFAALAAGLGVPHTDESMHADVIQFTLHAEIYSARSYEEKIDRACIT